MSLVINTNIASLNAQRQLLKSSNAMQTAMQRLSSGLRINSAKDDAAGLAISDRMTAQIRGLNQAVRNANDGISLAQVAEGALSESTNILQRMRELAVQAANDSNSAGDRASLQKEVNQLQQELQRIATTTQFNGKNVLDGTMSGALFQIGANANQNIAVTIGNAQTNAIGVHQVWSTNAGGGIADAVTTTANGYAGDTITISGASGTKAVTLAAGASAKSIAESVNGIADSTGVSATAVTYAQLTGAAGSGNISLEITGSSTATVSAAITSGNTKALADAINSAAGQTGVTAAYDSATQKITLTSSTGEDISIKTTAIDAGVTALNMVGLQEDGVTANAGTASLATLNNIGTVGGHVNFTSEKSFSITGATAGELLTSAASASSLSAVSGVNISTQIGANAALKVIDGALASISSNRADLGAVQNRFSSTIANLQSVSENLSAARSRVVDADFAAETSELSRAQILQQAGTAMLAQANASTQNVLSLLQG
jgi:flagellin